VDRSAHVPGAVALSHRRSLGVCAAVALAAATLAVLRVPSYDPTGWLIWGRQITHGELSTPGGPSWKPLPVVFTTLFAYAGASTAPLLWLVLARLGGVVAIVATYRLALRLGGRTGAIGAVAGLILSWDFVYN
jgi:hypothetical protein